MRGTLRATFIIGSLLMAFWWLSVRAPVRRTGLLLASSFSGQSSEIHLRPHDPIWENPGEVAAMSAELEALGFRPVGTFRAPEMPFMTFRGYVHPERDVVAGIMDTAIFGSFADFTSYYADGTTATASNSSICGRMDSMPGHTKICARGAPISELWELFLKQRPKGSAMVVPARDLIPLIEAQYRAEAKWYSDRSGPSIEEIRRNAVDEGIKVSEKELEQAQRATRLRDLRRQKDETTKSASSP